MFCTNCGKEIQDEEKICPFCNTEVVNEEDLVDETVDQNFEKSGEVFETKQEKSSEMYHCRKVDMPLSTASFFFMQVLFLIPFVNIILLLVWSFNKNTNSNRRAFARSILIWFLTFSIILLFIFIVMLFVRYPLDTGFWFQEFKNFINSIPEF